MRNATILSLTMALALVAGHGTIHATKVGEPAPGFSATDSKGATHNLADYRGKWVVLEWHNQGCPYVKKHYEGGNMQKLQKEWGAKGVAWLSVISSAEGQQGYVTAAQANAYVASMKAAPAAVLLDPTGEVGRLYDARVTPHMFVINPEGVVVYNGAIDDKATSDLADLATATNYVSAALSEGMAGKAVTVTTSKPYGCGVKYAK